MKFNVRFKVGNHLGSGSVYTLVDVCVSLVDRYALKEKEISAIVKLAPGEKFTNEDLEVTRLEQTRQEIIADAARQEEGK